MLIIIRSILSLIFGLSLMYLLLEFEVKHKRQLYLLGLFIIAVLINAACVWAFLGEPIFRRLYPLLIFVPSYFALLFVSRYKGVKLFFVQVSSFFLCSPPFLVGIITASFFAFNKTIQNIVCMVMFIPTWFVVYKYLRPSFHYMLRNTNKGWSVFCIIPLSYFVLVYYTIMYNNISAKYNSTLVIIALSTILTLAAYIMIILFFKQTREHLLLQNEQDLLKTQVTAAQVHLESLQKSQENTIIYRHDMRHHLNLINSYLTDNNQVEAQKYISEVEKSIQGAVVKKYCRNYTVNLILSSYIAKAKNEGVAVETQIDLPENTAVSDMDLCVIFANSIENAVNACKVIPNEKDRIIKIICKTKNNRPSIQITNGYVGTVSFVNDMPVSAEENHSLGTKSIAAVTQKYGGVYSFTGNDGLFQTSIIL